MTSLIADPERGARLERWRSWRSGGRCHRGHGAPGRVWRSRSGEQRLTVFSTNPTASSAAGTLPVFPSHALSQTPPLHSVSDTFWLSAHCALINSFFPQWSWGRGELFKITLSALQPMRGRNRELRLSSQTAASVSVVIHSIQLTLCTSPNAVCC